MISVSVNQVSKSFKAGKENIAALKDITLEVREREFFVFLGPSGSGKSTLLRCVAGLEEPDAGEISLAGEEVFSAAKGFSLDPADRGVGMVFQSYAIWPHLTVLDNVALPLVSGKKRMPKNKAAEKAKHALELVQMGDFSDRPASLLSGGQQQRVAVARALAIEPKILLMDEPLSNLDARLREHVRQELKTIASRIGITTLYVTHDQIEAMALASRIAILADGKVLQVSPPAEMYENPVSAQVAQFMGSINWLSGKYLGTGHVETAIGILTVSPSGIQRSGHVTLGIRPEDIRVSTSPTGEENEFEARLLDCTFLGDQTLYQVKVGSTELLWKRAGKLGLNEGLYIRLPKQNIQIHPAEP